MTAGWPNISALSTTDFQRGLKNAHNALYWLIRITNSYIPATSGQPYADLNWDGDKKMVVTPMFEGNLQVALELHNLEMYFLEDGEASKHSFWFDDRTPAHVQAWMLVELLHRGKDRDKFSIDLPYAADNLWMGDSEEHDSSEFMAELSVINQSFIKSAGILNDAVAQLGQSGDNPAAGTSLSIWSRSFAIGHDMKLGNGSTVRMGMSAGDQLRGCPFFFVDATGDDARIDYNPSNVVSLKRISEDNMSDADIVEILTKAVA